MAGSKNARVGIFSSFFTFVVPEGTYSRETTFNSRETTFNIFYGTSQSNHIYIFINIKV